MYLGLWTEIRPADDLSRLAERAAAVGFATLHAHFPEGCDERLARRLARAAAASGLAVVAVSGYANPLRPDDAPMGWSAAGLAGLVGLMPLLDARILVSWSGTYGAGLLDGHPDNGAPAALELLRRHVEELLPALDAAEAILALEPFHTHALGDAEGLAAFCAEVNSPYLGLVLDPPNLLPPDRWGDQAAEIAAQVAVLAPYIRLVHLKDMRLRGGAVDLPGPGQGVLDYPALLGAIRRADISAPLIVEHVPLDAAAAARRFVLAQAAASGV